MRIEIIKKGENRKIMIEYFSLPFVVSTKFFKTAVEQPPHLTANKIEK